MAKFLASNWPTVVLNVALLVAGVGTYLLGNEVVMQHPEVLPAITSVVAGANVILRLFGRAPVQPNASK